MIAARWLCALCAPLLAAGCTTSSVGDAAGAVAGIATGAATANPLVGYSVAIGVQAATDATIKYVLKSWQNDTQNVMANSVGDLSLGEVRAWAIKRTIPYGSASGTIQVVRNIDTPLAQCREVLFTLDRDKEGPAPFIANICRNGEHWRWAGAEPAVSRWNGLQ